MTQERREALLRAANLLLSLAWLDGLRAGVMVTLAAPAAGLAPVLALTLAPAFARRGGLSVWLDGAAGAAEVAWVCWAYTWVPGAEAALPLPALLPAALLGARRGRIAGLALGSLAAAGVAVTAHLGSGLTAASLGRAVFACWFGWAISLRPSEAGTRRVPLAVSLQRRAQVTELVAYILFQLREYLTSVSSVAEALPLQIQEPRARERAERLRVLVAECNGKVARLMSRVRSATTSRTPLKAEPVSIESVLRESLETAVAAFGTGPVRVRLSGADAAGSVEIDRDVLLGVFLSVFQNAVESLGSRGGLLDAAVSRRGDYAEVRVADDGGGVPADAQPRVFEPMFTTKAASGGLGLGLSMSQRALRRLGGNLSLASEAGRTAVILQIPLKPTLPLVDAEESTWMGRRADAGNDRPPP